MPIQPPFPTEEKGVDTHRMGLETHQYIIPFELQVMVTSFVIRLTIIPARRSVPVTEAHAVFPEEPFLMFERDQALSYMVCRVVILLQEIVPLLLTKEAVTLNVHTVIPFEAL